MSDNPADPFKKALAEATRVMADDPELSVSYTVDPSGVSGDAMRLPQVSRRMTRDEVLLARGTADALALHRRYHDAGTHSRYAPPGEMARELYEAMETARCEAMGARDMPGTTGNIDAKIGAEATRRGYDQIKEASEAPLATAAGYLIRHLATGNDLPAGAQNVMELWRGFIEDQAGGTLEDLQDRLSDQTEFAKFARQIINDLGYGDQLGDDPDEMDDESDEQAEDGAEEEQDPDSTGQDENDDEQSDASPEQSQDETQDASQAQVSMDEMADQEMGDESEMPEGEAPMEPPAPQPISDADP
ncbi:Aerobic cobaltochelatase subunit CobT [Nymphon striatum]|nr:Aerobic cobaltochelatase subunit CobT [Nymphon striatum]